MHVGEMPGGAAGSERGSKGKRKSPGKQGAAACRSQLAASLAEFLLAQGDEIFHALDPVLVVVPVVLGEVLGDQPLVKVELVGFGACGWSQLHLLSLLPPWLEA